MSIEGKTFFLKHIS